MVRKPIDIHVSKLRLDKRNYRLPPMDDKSEEEIVEQFIVSDGKHYLGLVRSILEKGFQLREALIVLDNGDETYRVIEGNRRASILRLIHGKIKVGALSLGKTCLTLLEKRRSSIKAETRRVPCIVYGQDEEREAYAELAPIHSVKDPSARQPWQSLAKARYECYRSGKQDDVLWLFGRFLEQIQEGDELYEKLALWSFSYPISALREAIQRLSAYYGLSEAELVENYMDDAVKPTVDAFIKYIGTTPDCYRKMRDITFTKEECARELGITLPSKEICVALQERIATSATTGEIDPGSMAPVPDSVQKTVCLRGTPVAKENASEPDFVPKAGGQMLTSPRAKSIPASDTCKGVVKQLSAIRFTTERYRKLQTLHKELVKLAKLDLPNVFAIALRSFLDIASVIYCDHHNCLKADKRSIKNRVSGAIDHIKQFAPGWKDNEQAQKLLENARNYLTKDTLLSISQLNEIVHNKDNSFTVTKETIMRDLGKIIPLMLALTENEPLE